MLDWFRTDADTADDRPDEVAPAAGTTPAQPEEPVPTGGPAEPQEPAPAPGQRRAEARSDVEQAPARAQPRPDPRPPDARQPVVDPQPRTDLERRADPPHPEQPAPRTGAEPQADEPQHVPGPDPRRRAPGPEPVERTAEPGAEARTAEPEQVEAPTAGAAADRASGEPDAHDTDDAGGPVAEPASTQARIVAVANQKGGVGKTTTTVSLAAALAEAGAQVLLVDLDPQGNATTGLGLRPQEGAPSTYRVLIEEMPVEDATEPTSVRGLHCLPSSLDLAGAEIELVSVFNRERRLSQGLEAVRDLYDVILIDCPPTLGLLTVNALAAADQVILPIQCEYYALEGVGQLTRTVDLVRRGLNPDLELGGVVLTMYDGRTKLSEQVADEVRSHFTSRVFRTIIPRTVRLSEAPSYGQPITVYDPSSRGARAYVRLADELARRLDLGLESRSPLDDLLGVAGANGDDVGADDPDHDEEQWA